VNGRGNNLMVKATGAIHCQVIIECPHCEEVMDLFDLDTMNDEGHLWKIIERRLKDRDFGKNLDETIECKDCGKEFVFDEIEF